jgi:hypothetical protein
VGVHPSLWNWATDWQSGLLPKPKAAWQSNQRLLAIVQASGYTGFESAAQRLSPTRDYAAVHLPTCGITDSFACYAAQKA